MFDPDGFEAFARSLAKVNGLSLAEASDYAALIGDTPELDEETGLVVVRDERGQVVAKVRLAGA